MLQWRQRKAWILSYIFCTFLGLLTSIWWKRHKEVRKKIPAHIQKNTSWFEIYDYCRKGEIHPNLNLIATLPETRESLQEQRKPWLSGCHLQNLVMWEKRSLKGKEALTNSCPTPSPVKFHLLQSWGDKRENDGCVLRPKLVAKLHVVMEIILRSAKQSQT